MRRALAACLMLGASLAGCGRGDTGSALPPLVDADPVQAFYREHEELFRRRQVFRLVEVTVRAPGHELQGFEARVARASDLADVTSWLKGRRLPFYVVATSRASEELPAKLLRQVSTIGARQMVLMPTAEGAVVIQVLGSHAAPLSERQARPLIEGHLRARERLPTP